MRIALVPLSPHTSQRTSTSPFWHLTCDCKLFGWDAQGAAAKGEKLTLSTCFFLLASLVTASARSLHLPSSLQLTEIKGKMQQWCGSIPPGTWVRESLLRGLAIVLFISTPGWATFVFKRGHSYYSREKKRKAFSIWSIFPSPVGAISACSARCLGCRNQEGFNILAFLWQSLNHLSCLIFLASRMVH